MALCKLTFCHANVARYSRAMTPSRPTLIGSLREPWNALTHWAGAALALPVLLELYAHARAAQVAAWPFVVFGVSMLLLYAASACYHSFRVSESGLLWLRKLDHSAIFLLIAGTYTPLVYFGLHAHWRSGILLTVWAVALLGMLLKLLTMKLPRWVSTLLYVGLGWLAAAFWPQFSAHLSPAALAWLCIGGVAYSAGAVVYGTKKWNPVPGVFGFHEVWHLFVLAGSAAHVVMMFYLR